MFSCIEFPKSLGSIQGSGDENVLGPGNSWATTASLKIKKQKQA